MSAEPTSRPDPDAVCQEPDAVRIREARAADLPAVLELFELLAEHQAGWRVFPPRDGFRRGMEGRYRDVIQDETSTLIVAEVGGTVLGMAVGQLNRPSSFSDEMALEVSSVVVRAGHRGRGIARALTAELARFARRQGARRLTLKTFAGNREALRAWERLGFQARMVQMTAAVDDLDPERPAPHLRHT